MLKNDQGLVFSNTFLIVTLQTVFWNVSHRHTIYLPFTVEKGNKVAPELPLPYISAIRTVLRN
jgi:hypothetical protein